MSMLQKDTTTVASNARKRLHSKSFDNYTTVDMGEDDMNYDADVEYPSPHWSTPPAYHSHQINSCNNQTHCNGLHRTKHVVQHFVPIEQLAKQPTHQKQVKAQSSSKQNESQQDSSAINSNHKPTNLIHGQVKLTYKDCFHWFLKAAIMIFDNDGDVIQCQPVVDREKDNIDVALFQTSDRIHFVIFKNTQRYQSNVTEGSDSAINENGNVRDKVNVFDAKNHVVFMLRNEDKEERNKDSLGFGYDEKVFTKSEVGRIIHTIVFSMN